MRTCRSFAINDAASAIARRLGCVHGPSPSFCRRMGSDTQQNPGSADTDEAAAAAAGIDVGQDPDGLVRFDVFPGCGLHRQHRDAVLDAVAGRMVCEGVWGCRDGDGVMRAERAACAVELAGFAEHELAQVARAVTETLTRVAFRRAEARAAETGDTIVGQLATAAHHRCGLPVMRHAAAAVNSAPQIRARNGLVTVHVREAGGDVTEVLLTAAEARQLGEALAGNPNPAVAPQPAAPTGP